MMKNLSILFLGFALIVTTSCSGSAPDGGSSATNPTASNNNASFNKEDYPVFPDADAGADPSVPADQGGRGFSGEGWETNTTFDLIGDPRAIKGGVFREFQAFFPGSLRIYGPESN